MVYHVEKVTTMMTATDFIIFADTSSYLKGSADALPFAFEKY